MSVARRPELQLYPLWMGLGVVQVIMLVFFSLTSVPVVVPVVGWDKVEHFFAYFWLTGWFVQLQPQRMWRRIWLVGFILLGASLEYLQQFTPDRMMDWMDLLANTAGAISSYLLCRGELGLLMYRIEQRWM